jgi:hypothetical protein
MDEPSVWQKIWQRWQEEEMAGNHNLPACEAGIIRGERFNGCNVALGLALLEGEVAGRCQQDDW